MTEAKFLEGEGDFGSFKRAGSVTDDTGWKSNLLNATSVTAMQYLDDIGLKNESMIATDPYDWFCAKELLDWRAALRTVLPHLEEPFSGPSGHQYICHRLHADSDNEEYMIALSSNDARGVIDHVIIWEELGETHVISKMQHMPVVVTLLRRPIQ